MAVGSNVTFILKNIHKNNQTQMPSIQHNKGKQSHQLLVTAGTYEDLILQAL